jgi:hypothetical protein
VAATDVEDHLVTPPRDGVEQAACCADLADGAPPQVPAGVAEQDEPGPQGTPNYGQPDRHGDDACDGAGRKRTWGVEPVPEVGLDGRRGDPCHIKPCRVA